MQPEDQEPEGHEEIHCLLIKIGKLIGTSKIPCSAIPEPVVAKRHMSSHAD